MSVDVADGQDGSFGQNYVLIAASIVGAVCFVIFTVFLLFQCLCCEKLKHARRRRSSSNYDYYYANVRGKRVHSNPNENRFPVRFDNVRYSADDEVVSPRRQKVAYNRADSGNVRKSKNSALKNGTAPHRALPAPPSEGTLTRDSSTSELYASVDKNAQIDGARAKRQSAPPPMVMSALASTSAHFYTKIRGDDHVYSKIWTTNVSENIGAETYDNLTAADDSDFDPFYSRVNENEQRKRQEVSSSSKLIKSPNGLRRNNVHPYEYPRFVSDKQAQQDPIVVDPFYSKIGGSEDPYSSIKSEEHYSRVDREDDALSVDTTSNAATVRRRIVFEYDDPYFPYAVPGPSTDRVVRRYSDGDEYALVKKRSAGGAAVYSTPMRRGPPRVPVKRVGTNEEVLDVQLNVEVVDDEMMDHGEAGEAGGKEPSYRYITVRESLDALRERMEQQRRPLATNYAAVSDPSLHYYSTISEHSYEVVPSRFPTQRVQEAAASSMVRSNFDDALYIDQDELTGASDVTISRPDLNSTLHSDDLTLTTGSHITLVHVDTAHSTSDADRGEAVILSRPASVPPPVMPNNSSEHFYDRLNYGDMASSSTVDGARCRRHVEECGNGEYPTTLCFCHSSKQGNKQLIAAQVDKNRHGDSEKRPREGHD